MCCWNNHAGALLGLPRLVSVVHRAARSPYFKFTTLLIPVPSDKMGSFHILETWRMNRGLARSLQASSCFAALNKWAKPGASKSLGNKVPRRCFQSSSRCKASIGVDICDVAQYLERERPNCCVAKVAASSISWPSWSKFL